ncbi:MAG: family 1 encapsulin nanocompartment shell protein [Ignisphaera sp.]
MLSKHPLDLPVGRKLTREEVAEALRLAVIAELDAINLYLQLARAIEDEKIRKVFEDIAKEEKTHVGEFLAVLKSLDSEQVEELRKGAEEVSRLTGLEVKDPPNNGSEDVWKGVLDVIAKTVDSVRIFRKYLPVTVVGRGVDGVPLEAVGSGTRVVIPLEEISVEFKVSQRSVDYGEVYKLPTELGDGYRAAVEFASMEDRFILEKLLKLSNTIKLDIGSWDEPGQALREVSEAISKMLGGGVREPFILFVSPARYAKLLAVHERTGVMEITRIKGIVKEVVATPILPDDTALLVSANPYVLDVVVGVDTKIDYLGPENGYHKLRIWETIAVRPRMEKGIAVLKQVK